MSEPPKIGISLSGNKVRCDYSGERRDRIVSPLQPGTVGVARGTRAIRPHGRRRVRDRLHLVWSWRDQNRREHRNEETSARARVRVAWCSRRLLSHRLPQRAVKDGVGQIGAQFDGILRAHRLAVDGIPRDSARSAFRCLRRNGHKFERSWTNGPP
jgi:hypothetical protein